MSSIVSTMLPCLSSPRDPLFFGYTTTLMREFPGLVRQTFPSFSSLQLLAHALRLPYHDMSRLAHGEALARIRSSTHRASPQGRDLDRPKEYPHALLSVC